MKLLALALIGLAAFNAHGGQSTGYGQITFENRTSVAGDMYVDGVYQCRALARLMCTAQIVAGEHAAEFRFVDGDVVTTPPIMLEAGQSITIPVVEQESSGGGASIRQKAGSAKAAVPR